MEEEGRPQRHCPHLGLKHTKAIRFSNPTAEHRCYIFGDPIPIEVDQRTFCLGEGYVSCPRYIGQEPPPSAAAAQERVQGVPSARPRERRPSRLAIFWQQLSRRDRILYLSLIGVLVAILATYGVIAGIVLPNMEDGTPTAVADVTVTSAPPPPTEQPTVPTVEPTKQVVVPTTAVPVQPTATSRPTSPSPTHTPAPTDTPEHEPTETAVPPSATPVVVVPTSTPPDVLWSTLYFLGPGKAYYVPVTRQGPYTEGIARRAIEFMIEGPRPNLLRSIPEGMQLNDIYVQGGTLYVDFDQRFEDLGAGAEEAMAVVLAMTEFSTVQQVQFLVNGSPVGLPGSGDAGPVARPRYVNFENPYGLAPEESVALTLYFATPDGLQLFPIVRRVAFTEGTARATIEQMVSGPSDVLAGLAVSPLPPDLQILNIYRDGNTIVIDFNAAFRDAPNQDRAINALALAMTSLTADSNQGIVAVSISVEGSFVGTYYRPLLNPE